MRKENLIKLLILILAVSCGAEAYADTQAVLQFRTSVPLAAGVRKKAAASPAASVSPQTGIITGELGVAFELDSNDAENEVEFVITASVETSDGTKNAYDGTGNILFSNVSNLPSETDVNEALSHTGANNNVIAYPVTMTTASPLTSTFKTGYKEFGNCYVIDMHGETEGSVSHNINPQPVPGTFSTTRDTSGTYQSVVTITAVNK